MYICASRREFSFLLGGGYPAIDVRPIDPMAHRRPGAKRSGGSTHAHREAEDEYRVPWDDDIFGCAPRFQTIQKRLF